MGILWYLVVGLVIGWIAGVLVKGGGGNLVWNIIVGIVGAEIGGWLARVLGMNVGLPGSIIMAIIGAIILLLVLRVIKKMFSSSSR